MVPKKKDSKKEEDKEEFSYKIENVVATVTLTIEEKLDLMLIARKYSDVEYNPERFPGLIMRVKEPKATILIFSTGKLVVTGLRAASEAESVVKQSLDRLRACNIEIPKPEIVIQNIVASGDLNCLVDLNMAAVVMEYSMYEPEVFPGLIYRMQVPHSVFLIFSTGKIVCTGCKTDKVVAEATKKLYHTVREYGVAMDPEELNDFDIEEEMTFL